MASRNWVLAIIEFYILTNLAGLTVTHGNSLCGNLGNYTQNSAYEKNLNDTLSALIQGYNGSGFFRSTSNSTQDDATSRVYAIALCSGEFEADRCLACVASSATRLRQDCPNQKKATGWYFATCMVSYSNTSLDIIGYNDEKDVLPFSSTSDIVNWHLVVENLRNLFKQLREKATTDGYNETFYSDSINLQSPEGLISATMQCIPNISRSNCNECLVIASENLVTLYNGSTYGALYYRYSCLLKYEISIVNNIATSPLMPPTNPAILSRGKKRSKVIIPAVVAASVVTLIISAFLIYPKVRRMCTRKDDEDLFEASDDDTEEIPYFRLKAMQAATSNFSAANKLGEGGFGPVYWGELPGGKKIAVKRLSQNSSQGMQEFKTEVKLIIKLQHKNLVKLLGCCMKGKERLLVYEYMSNNSLDNYLFDPKKAKELDWAKRVNIVNGIAKGLRYLHEDSRLKIIHRDLKASNILLDEEMNPKISDFGTARIFGSNQVEANTDRVVGTYGYMAPEYAMEGIFSIKSDVYSFGVLLLEMMSGKRNTRWSYQEHNQSLLCYAWMLWEKGTGEELIDENLNDDCPVDEAIKWMRIALLCIEEDPNDRPTMSSVCFMLEGELKSLSEPKPPMYFVHGITSDQSSATWNGGEVTFFSCDM